MDVCKGKGMEGSIRVVGQVLVIIICTNVHSYRRPGNRLQEVTHCYSSKVQPLAYWRPKMLGVRRDTGSRRGVLVRQEEETLHRNGGRVLG